MCTEGEHKTHKLLDTIRELIDGRPPLDDHVVISSVKPWNVDYKERKHVFIWLPTTQTLSFEEYGTGTVQAQVWINLGMPHGIKVLAPSATGTVDMMIRCTDEEIP
jgi:hypothetical protein